LDSCFLCHCQKFPRSTISYLLGFRHPFSVNMSKRLNDESLDDQLQKSAKLTRQQEEVAFVVASGPDLPQQTASRVSQLS
jgi:hypothetical protein